MHLLDDAGEIVTGDRTTLTPPRPLRYVPERSMLVAGSAQVPFDGLTDYSKVKAFRLSVAQLSGPGMPAERADDGRLIIPATEPWRDAGLNVIEGQVVRISATGKVQGSQTDPNNWAFGPFGPKGTKSPQGEPFAGEWMCALMGSVGGKEFYIGDAPAFTAPATGRLYLGVSDFHYGDNSGEFLVTLETGTD